MAVAFGFPMGMLDDAGQLVYMRGWAAVYVATISMLTEAIALTAFGLVRSWGEITPRWLPLIGNRPIHPLTAVIPATLGSLALFLIWTVGFWDIWSGQAADTMADPLWAAVFVICYAPLNLWGPFLLILTLAYHRRRTHRRG